MQKNEVGNMDLEFKGKIIGFGNYYHTLVDKFVGDITSHS